MKKVCAIAIFLMMGLVTFAQDAKETYCEVIGRSAISLRGKIKVEVDFGQENKVFEGINSDVLKDPATGKNKKFNSMIDALNFMASKGWVFVNAYNVSSSNSGATGSGMANEFHYIMKKTVE